MKIKLVPLLLLNMIVCFLLQNQGQSINKVVLFSEIPENLRLAYEDELEDSSLDYLVKHLDFNYLKNKILT